LKRLGRIAAALVLAYGALCGVLYFAQRSLLYFPSGEIATPADRGVEASVITATTADGETLKLWWAPPREGRAVVIHFHGNGGNQSLWSGVFRDLIASGYGLLSLSYRGYGGSTGKPSEQGLIEDARAAFATATTLARGSPIVLFGDSLGSGVATALAAEKPISGLILNAPFTAVVDVAQEVYPFLPARLLMTDTFLSRERITRVRAPILMLHGDQDETVPFAQGQRLFALAPEPKRFVAIPGGRHSNLWRNGGREAVIAFLEALPRQTLVGAR
jgi:fermentation-respiration switch protein FrsA (DUF1100 family)